MPLAFITVPAFFIEILKCLQPLLRVAYKAPVATEPHICMHCSVVNDYTNDFIHSNKFLILVEDLLLINIALN